LGSSTELAADGNDDGVVDGDDLLIWKEHFGAGGSAMATSSQVPEPASQLLAFGSCALLGGATRRQRFASC
jgi:hypothetical protein